MALTKVILLLAFLAASAAMSPSRHKKLAKQMESLHRIRSVDRVEGDYRLPNNTAPISYDIRLIPYIEVDNFTFDGEADIFFELLEATSTITLHSSVLTYDETLTTLVSQDGVYQNITNHTYVTEQEFLIIEVEKELEVGNYTLSFSFVGILSDSGQGFYRIPYIDASGDIVWVATTEFEATYARQAFPCFDEPALKATFDIAIKHKPEFHALSNMPIAEEITDDEDGKVWTTFETTPVMSTYLVAFVVSDFLSIQNDDGSYRVWSRPNGINEAQWAYDIGIIEMAELENFTNVNYSLPKIDQISFPYYSGGMENWGLVVYGDDSVYYNESTDKHVTKQNVAAIISHELSHQWFGNLVSPAWWKYLWLNEGFATYFEFYTTDAVQYNWRTMEQFVVMVQQWASFLFDAHGDFAVRVNQDVASPDEIDEKFDYTSYEKPACIVRMMSHFLTEDVFKVGLTKYLTANANSAVTPDDLYEALQEAASEANILPDHVYVKDILDTWVEQSGYPVVTITRNYTTGTTEITQERFLLANVTTADDHDYKWWIPINWATQSNPDFSSTSAADWIRSQDKSIMINGFDVEGWVIFNKQQTGFYRVNYDDTNWGMIASYLNNDNYLYIHPLNRAALIDDAITLAKAARLSWSVVFELTLYLQREVDHIPWYNTFLGFQYIEGLLANTNDHESLRTYFAFLLSNIFNSTGIEETESDDHLTLLYRTEVMSAACNYGIEICRSGAEAKLVAWLDDSTANPLPADLRTNIICAGLRGASAVTWNKALNKYLTTESKTERDALLTGLGCSEDEAIVNNWLNVILDPTTGLSNDDSDLAFLYVNVGSAYNSERTFDFIVNNVDKIISHFGNNESVENFVYDSARRFTTQAQLDKLNTFIADHPAIFTTEITTAVRTAEENIAWNAVHGKEIGTWLDTWLATLEETTTTTEVPSADTEATITTTEGYGTTITTEVPSADTEVSTTTTEDYETTTPGGSAATAYLSSFVVILGFVCLVGMNY